MRHTNTNVSLSALTLQVPPSQLGALAGQEQPPPEQLVVASQSFLHCPSESQVGAAAGQAQLALQAPEHSFCTHQTGGEGGLPEVGRR